MPKKAMALSTLFHAMMPWEFDIVVDDGWVPAADWHPSDTAALAAKVRHQARQLKLTLSGGHPQATLENRKGMNMAESLLRNRSFTMLSVEIQPQEVIEAGLGDFQGSITKLSCWQIRCPPKPMLAVSQTQLYTT